MPGSARSTRLRAPKRPLVTLPEGLHPRGEAGTNGRIEFAAGTVDFELGCELVRAPPAQDILPAALGMPKDGVRS